MLQVQLIAACSNQFNRAREEFQLTLEVFPSLWQSCALPFAARCANKYFRRWRNLPWIFNAHQIVIWFSSLAFRAVFARESTLIIGERFACIMEHNSMPRRVTDASLARNSINNHHTTERIDKYLFSHRISGRAWRQDPPDHCEHETVSIISVNRQTRQSVGGDVLGIFTVVKD